MCIDFSYVKMYICFLIIWKTPFISPFVFTKFTKNHDGNGNGNGNGNVTKQKV